MPIQNAVQQGWPRVLPPSIILIRARKVSGFEAARRPAAGRQATWPIKDAEGVLHCLRPHFAKPPAPLCEDSEGRRAFKRGVHACSKDRFTQYQGVAPFRITANDAVDGIVVGGHTCPHVTLLPRKEPDRVCGAASLLRKKFASSFRIASIQGTPGRLGGFSEDGGHRSVSTKRGLIVLVQLALYSLVATLHVANVW